MRYYEISNESWEDYPPWEDHGTSKDFELNSLGVLSWDDEMNFQQKLENERVRSSYTDRIKLDNIIGSEKYVYIKSSSKNKRSSTIPIVAKLNGKYRVQDGNHRLHELKKSGKKEALVKVYDYDD